MSKHWSAALMVSMKDPTLKVLSSDTAIVIKDKYPKAKFHFLVLPFENIPSIYHLTGKHLYLLEELELLGLNAIEVVGQVPSDFKVGYHVSPSMQHLHMHVISKDFVSQSLKTKHHWNSFNTDLFLTCEDIRHSLERDKKLEKPPETKIKELENSPLKCNQCDYMPKNMPDLRTHLINHLPKN